MADRWTEYLVLPELVAPPPDLAERIRALGREITDSLDAAKAADVVILGTGERQRQHGDPVIEAFHHVAV